MTTYRRNAQMRVTPPLYEMVTPCIRIKLVMRARYINPVDTHHDFHNWQNTEMHFSPDLLGNTVPTIQSNLAHWLVIKCFRIHFTNIEQLFPAGRTSQTKRYNQLYNIRLDSTTNIWKLIEQTKILLFVQNSCSASLWYYCLNFPIQLEPAPRFLCGWVDTMQWQQCIRRTLYLPKLNTVDAGWSRSYAHQGGYPPTRPGCTQN